MQVSMREPRPKTAESQPAGGDLELLPGERPHLAAAMKALGQGDSRAFCDILWLGMGDRYRDVLRSLEKGNFVAVVDPDSCEGVQIKDRGRQLIEVLGSMGN
jgi:hypothetical protein